MGSGVESAYNIHDLEAMARRRLPRAMFDFIARGAEDETTMRANGEGLKRIALRPRIGVDVSRRDLSIRLFGRKQSMPIAIGVTGFSGMIAHRGEMAVARAAHAAGIPMTLGTFNLVSVRELPSELRANVWYQTYPMARRDLMDHQMASVRAAGIDVLHLTVDSALPGNREYLKRSGFSMPPRPTFATMLEALRHPRWLLGTYLRDRVKGAPRFGNLPVDFADVGMLRGNRAALQLAQDFDWDCIRRLRDQWRGILVLKGLATAEDARLAAEIGADGVVVSNHGGRALDGCIASIDALPEIVDAVGGRISVLVDGGFVRGKDVVKALALGASSVLIGRAAMFGLAAGGEAGVARALDIFREEIDRTLAQVGCRCVADLKREHVRIGAGTSYLCA